MNYETVPRDLNGQPLKGKCTIMEIMKLTIKKDFHYGTGFFSRFLITKSNYLKRHMTF